MPEEYRDTVAAVDVGGLTYAEAARALDVPEGTIMSRLSRRGWCLPTRSPQRRRNDGLDRRERSDGNAKACPGVFGGG